MEEGGDQAIHVVLAHRAQAFLLLLEVAVRVVNDQVEIVGFGDVLDAAHEGRVKRVGDVGDNGGDGEGLAGAQAARVAVRHVTKLVDHVQYALAGFFGNGHRGGTVEHLGNGSLRYARQQGDIVLCGSLIGHGIKLIRISNSYYKDFGGNVNTISGFRLK